MDEGLRDPRRSAKRRSACRCSPTCTRRTRSPTVAAVVDVLQTPAFLCRQTDFIQAVARAGKPVNIKKGQFLAPEDMMQVVDKAKAASGADNIMVCERGASFGYHNLVSDMRSLAIMRDDRTARSCSTRRIRCSCPAGRARRRGGQREFVPVLARAAVAAGVAGVFMETHPRSGEGAVRRPERVAAAADARAARDAEGARRRGEARGLSRAGTDGIRADAATQRCR